MLNPDKSEAIWCTTSQRQHQLPTATILVVGVPITPVRFVCDLCIYIDADLLMWAHVNRTVLGCFAALRQLRHIRRPVPAATFQILVVALVHSLLDYGNAVLVGIPTYLVRRLQSVLNAAAWLIYHLRPHDHITEELATLHWLHIPERVQCKIAVLMYKVLHESAPRYLGSLVTVADLPGRRAVWSASTSYLVMPPIKLTTVGNRAFPVAAAQVWNSLPEAVISSSSMQSFRRQLKIHLFQLSVHTWFCDCLSRLPSW